MNETIGRFYAAQSEMSDPGRFAYLYEELPEDLGSLIEAFGNVLLQREDAREAGISRSGTRIGELSCKRLFDRLEGIVQIDPSPLTSKRAIQHRQICQSRDLALFTVSVLRHRGVSARMRIAFAAYGSANPRVKDLVWLAEIWEVSRKTWRLVDPRLAISISDPDLAGRSSPLRPDIDPLNLVAGEDVEPVSTMWRLVRSKELSVIQLQYDGQSLGMRGLRSALLHDLYALNRLELQMPSNWDALGSKPERAITPIDRTFLDRIADVLADPDRTFEEMRRCFDENPGTQVVLSKLHALRDRPKRGGSLARILAESEIDRLAAAAGASPSVSDAKRHAPTTRTQGTAEAMGTDLVVRGARQNNLRGIDVRIPRDRFTVVTGVSGSGKSSLVFDTIYAESRRRFMETLSPFTRQFARQMEKPDVDRVHGLIPAVALEQKSVSPNSLSTVGSITSVIDMLRVLFARAGRMHCPSCGRPVEACSAQLLADRLLDLPEGTQIKMLSSSVTIEAALSEADRRSALHEAVETAYRLSDGIARIRIDEDEYRFSNRHTCPYCDLQLPEPTPSLLNPRTARGTCERCMGTGLTVDINRDRLVPDPSLSLLDGAIALHGPLTAKKNDVRRERFGALAKHFDADIATPWLDLPEGLQRVILDGSGEETVRLRYSARNGSVQVDAEERIQGVADIIRRLYRQTRSEASRAKYLQYMRQMPCEACEGERLAPEGRMMALAGTRFPELVSLSIAELSAWIDRAQETLGGAQGQIANDLLTEIEKRLAFLRDVGLHYLSLDRAAPTLSAGELQRIRLASQIGSELVGVLYVLDEPSVGLHPKDREPLLALLRNLRDLGNTVLVVEHDRHTMCAADWIIDIGPGAGQEGGDLVAQGTVEQIEQDPNSITGAFLSGNRRIAAVHRNAGRAPCGWLTLHGARLHNLKNIDVRVPLGVLTCATGVSGSGKSSLFAQTLVPAVKQIVGQGEGPGADCDSIEGGESIRRVLHITQAPIGRNPRSNPATFVGLFDEIRALFAGTPEAKVRGLAASAFSFNVKGGRCDTCEGLGAIRIDMKLLPDLWIRCSECGGKRYGREVLDVRWGSHTIAEVLEMEVREAAALFAKESGLSRKLEVLLDAGLGYLRLGQSATTLSGGEAQRLKLAKELARDCRSDTLYVLDEPTAGLHFEDIERLIGILHRLAAEGNTVVVLEHDLDVIQTADWIIDLGPGGGEEGGRIVAEGRVDEIAATGASFTGKALKGIS